MDQGERIATLEARMSGVESSVRDLADLIRAELQSSAALRAQYDARDAEHTRNVARFWDQQWPEMQGQIRALVDGFAAVRERMAEGGTEREELARRVEHIEGQLESIRAELAKAGITRAKLVGIVTGAGAGGAALAEIVRELLLP